MKKYNAKYIGFSVLVAFFCMHSLFATNQWTWFYVKHFSCLDRVKNIKNNSMLFGKRNIEKFSQLIFSFNALRPIKGYFTFYVKTRNASSKKWGKWHKMIDWGNNVQKSYFSKDTDATYMYVRLETGLKNLADGFCIKVETKDGAPLASVRGVCACVSDFNKFRNEVIGSPLLSLKSVHVNHVPKISQRVLRHPHANCLCSPTSCSMLASYFNKKRINACKFADKVFDFGLNVYGSWPFNVAALYNECYGKINVYTKRMNSFRDIHKKLINKIPVVVSVRGAIKGAQKKYSSGHLMVVVGWDAKGKKVICHDPAFYSDKNTFARYDINSFVRAWERSHRLSYVAELRRI